jgi:hypothetical protein
LDCQLETTVPFPRAYNSSFSSALSHKTAPISAGRFRGKSSDKSSAWVAATVNEIQVATKSSGRGVFSIVVYRRVFEFFFQEKNVKFWQKATIRFTFEQ